MNTKTLPTKLSKEPIVEVVCEIQLTANAAFSQVMPGVLFSKLEGVEIVKSPSQAMIPAEIIAKTPGLKFSPLSSLIWKGYGISFSNHSMQIRCVHPYPGWTKFKTIVEKLITITLNSGTVDSISRYSLKYTDLVGADEAEQRVSFTSLNLKLGDIELINQNFQVQIEIKRDPIIHLVQLASPVSVENKISNKVSKGTLITTDSIVIKEFNSIDSFKSELSNNLDTLHNENKTIFFECISEDGLKSLEPNYD